MGLLFLVFGLMVRGYFRGLLEQVLGTAGVLIGIWSGFVIHRWVGAQWLGVQPTVVFWVLRWLVTFLGASAVVALFGVAAETLGRAVRESPVGWLDRWSGVLTGALLGGVCASLIVLGAVKLPFPSWVHQAASRSRCSRPLLVGGAEACRLGLAVPGGALLRRQYLEARHRLDRRPLST